MSRDESGMGSQPMPSAMTQGGPALRSNTGFWRRPGGRVLGLVIFLGVSSVGALLLSQARPSEGVQLHDAAEGDVAERDMEEGRWRPVGDRVGRGSPTRPAPSATRALALSNEGSTLESAPPGRVDGAPMQRVPGGEYTLGDSSGRYDEQPPISALLSGFHIDRDEVNNRRFERFVRESHYVPEGPWRRGFGSGQDRLPVRFVTWNDAAAYARWAGCRLPTEAQWEAAAKMSADLEQPAVIGRGFASGPVATVGGNGIHHMAGNVREWTADWYDRYRNRELSQRGIVVDPTGPEDHAQAEARFIESDAVAGNERSTRRVVRGASWAALSADSARPAARGAHSPHRFYDDVGFRCAMSEGDPL